MLSVLPLSQVATRSKTSRIVQLVRSHNKIATTNRRTNLRDKYKHPPQFRVQASACSFRTVQSSDFALLDGSESKVQLALRNTISDHHRFSPHHQLRPPTPNP